MFSAFDAISNAIEACFYGFLGQFNRCCPKPGIPFGNMLLMALPNDWLENIAQTDQIVGNHMRAKHPTDVFIAAQLALAQAA